MGLDMFIFKIKRFENATLDDVRAVEGWTSLQRYKKEHPDYKGTMKDWCGMKKPSDKLIKFYSALEKTDEHGFTNIAEGVAYWRKANAIHKWFVDNVQDGEDDCEIHRELTREDLVELRGLAHEVYTNPDLAGDLLPTESGFFFGSTRYDDWYLDDLKETIRQIDNILKTTDFESEALYYCSSW